LHWKAYRITRHTVYSSAFTSTHCTQPWMDGQTELTWMANQIPRWRRRKSNRHTALIAVLTWPDRPRVSISKYVDQDQRNKTGRQSTVLSFIHIAINLHKSNCTNEKKV